MTRRVLLGTAIVLALAGGCGSDDEPTPGETTASAPTGATGTTDPEALNDAVIEQAQESPEAALQERGKEIEAILAKQIERYRPGPNQYPAPGVDDPGDDCSVLFGAEAVPRNSKEEQHVIRGPKEEDLIYVDNFPWGNLPDCLVTAREALGW